MDKIKLLESEIASKTKELELLKKNAKNELRNKTIRPLSEISDNEKITKFDELYLSAETMLNEKISTGFDDEDNPHYTWEKVMELLARHRTKFWDYYNKLG